ncbi:MAG TPA: TPM domain-containing protein [Clostridia bacterium]|nr:TPM domain-containing protein [Clostridia bacterium]
MVKRNFRKAISIIFVLLLVISIAGPVYADKELVADQAGLFTEEEAESLRQAAVTLGEKYSMDIVIVTTSDAEGKSSRDYADDYFDYNGYGIGGERDGILFLLDYDNREAYISTSGSGIRYLTDERIERILDEVFENGLTDGDNFGAANAFLETAEGYLAAGIPGDQHSVPEPVANTLSVAEAVAGAAVSGAFGLGFFTMIKSRYKGKPRPGIFEYRKNSIVNMGITADNLANQYVTTRIIPKSPPPSSSGSSGRSTTHRSSSGRSHGGGGRKF